MAINWFPGHMNKARRELSQAIGRVDVAIELLDARLPHSSRNPMLGELLGDRPRLVLLNKSDLADPEATRRWLHRLNGNHPAPCLEFAANDSRTAASVLTTCRRLAPHRSGAGKSVRVMVLGIPNVGKSTLINSLLGRRLAKVEDRPAVTRSQRSFQLEGGIRLSDTPGVLWPRLADQAGARRLAVSGAIRETAFDVVEMALFALGFLAERYPGNLCARFDLESADAKPEALLEAVGRRRGLLRRGGNVDGERAAALLLNELRSGRIGRLSFETPDDFEAEG